MLKKIAYICILSSMHIVAKMELISPAFSHNEPIPVDYTCDGTNTSPALSWKNQPYGTQSIALIVEDPDAPAGVWTHWILFNIPATVDHIPINAGADGQEIAFMQGATDFNSAQSWGGPCPPRGTHHYHFTLYALDTILDLTPGATKNQLLQAMSGHILEKTTLTGTYQRTKQSPF